MRLDELVNENYNRLNDNDLLIWQYIQNHKRECCSVSIEELAGKCCISRTTISRFAQKLGFEGFGEFKIHLKLEYDAEKAQKSVLLEDVCLNYVKCIETARDTDMGELCEAIYKANRLFVFGTGEVQNSAAQMLKRMFMNEKRFFVALAGKSELAMALEDLEPGDLMIIISLSGETELAVQAAKKAKGKGAYLVSITGLSNNTVAKLSHKSLYITTNHLRKIGGVSLEACSAYFNLIEILLVKYLLYREQKDSGNRRIPGTEQ